MAPGSDGTLFVSIPRSGGSVLALLDRSGRPGPGWPITVKNTTGCGLLLAVDDGSVRVVCNGTDLPQFDNDPSDVRTFAFDAGGRSMAGWPVQLRPGAGYMVGEELTFLEAQQGMDMYNTGMVSHAAWVTTVAADGSLRRGVLVPMVATCCRDEWAVGPDGIAYGVESVGEWGDGSAEVSRIMAFDLSGVRAGWPVKIDGITSGPAFGPGGKVVVTVGSEARGTSRVLVFERGGKAASASSIELPIATDPGPEWDCGSSMQPPLVSQDGTTFVVSEIDTAIFALDPSLKVRHGWPFEPATPLERPFPLRGDEGINCSSLALPAVGPDSTLYLPLQARAASVGGTVVAVGPDGKVRPGWPVELKRPGAEFWSVVVGSDGTAYALAIEPESAGKSSATILAIAPDSTVRYTTTIVEP